MYRVLGRVCYVLSASSIALSLVMWLQRQNRPKGIGQLLWRPNYEAAERVGIFVGLWAPTLAIAGKALEDRIDVDMRTRMKQAMPTTDNHQPSGSIIDRVRAGLASRGA